jgi:hypothetical protein
MHREVMAADIQTSLANMDGNNWEFIKDKTSWFASYPELLQSKRLHCTRKTGQRAPHCAEGFTRDGRLRPQHGARAVAPVRRGDATAAASLEMRAAFREQTG